MMAISKADKAMEYASFAEHCLKIAKIIPDREDRIIQREMAGEWFKLASQAAADSAQGAALATRKAKGRTAAS
jgi:hypothetical protein